MGYGRSGMMFASEHASITPDIMCLGKGMAAGYLPISATVVTESIYSSFRDKPDADRTFYHGHTFTGNPIAAATAIETLKVYQDEQILENMAPLIDSLASHLSAFAALDIVTDVGQIGMVGAIETGTPSDPAFAMRVCAEARKRGALLRPLGNTLYLWPPLNITRQELASLSDILMESIVHISRT
jgi:adenosylmethionine---8-amino-7-oxononanoate aminotransferase